MEKKTINDQVNVKIKWICPTKAIKRGKSKNHDERKGHYDNNPKSL
jgi:hypothetical protein